MKSLLKLTLVLGLIATAGSATAVQMFDFDAQAILPTTVGSAAEAYGIIVNGDAVDTPLPLDFANFEYTIVVTGLILDSTGSTSIFSGGTVVIYEDDATAADWAVPAGFSDGVAILSGTLATFQHTMLLATVGSGQGYVDWTGGTRLNELAPADQTGWPFLTTVSRAATQVEPGYTEKWDGKVEPTEDVVATEVQSWSNLKVLFR
ncbi:MAG: hypothetical protein ABFS42_04600 [Candidatus Krumholzibacteriota bacterium]